MTQPPILPILLISTLVALLSGCNKPTCGEGQGTLALDGAAIVYQHAALPVLNINITAEAAAALPQTVDDPRGPNQFVTVDYGEYRFEAGLKLKGTSTFRNLSEKPSFKLDFEEWSHDENFFGVRRLTLNNMVNNPSKMAEALSYTLYGWMGIVAPRHGYACISVNDEPYGVYSVVETMDEDFIDHNFDDDNGNLYEGTYGADLGGTHPDLFTLEEETEDSLDALWALSSAVDDVDGQWLTLLGTHFDADAVLTGWAIELGLGNADGYAVANNNFLLYHEPSQGKWTFIPWGTDLAMLATIAPDDPPTTGGALFVGCLSEQSCHDALNEAMLAVATVMKNNDLHGYSQSLVDLIGNTTRHEERDEQTRIQTSFAQWTNVRYLRSRPGVITDALTP